MKAGTMTFASPELLFALLLVPIALVAYLLLQRRRARYVVRFTGVRIATVNVDNGGTRVPGIDSRLYLFLRAFGQPGVTLGR